MSRHVVITGLGPTSAVGLGIGPTWQAAIEGRTAISPIESFDPSSFDCRIAAEIIGFRAQKYVPKWYRKATKVMARDIGLAVAGADLAARDAGIKTRATTDNGEDRSYSSQRMGAHIGAGLIAAELDELTSGLAEARDANGAFDIHQWGQEGMQHLTPLWLLKYLPNMLACHVTILHDAQGPSNTITCTEASAGLSIGESLRVIQRGDADMCFCGGADSKLNPTEFLRLLMTGRYNTTEEDDPQLAVRPFCQTAAGSIIGEGGAIVVLEARDTFEQRRAQDKPMGYAEIVGFGAAQSINRNAKNLLPDPKGSGIDNAISIAIGEAGIDPQQIDLVIPTGIGHPDSDRAEVAALKRVFGDYLSKLPVISNKALFGNCSAGAGGLDACIAAKALAEQTLPAIVNCKQPWPGLASGTTAMRPADLRYALICSCGLGGQIAALVLKRYDNASP